jgi:hypothetical protein
LKKKLKLQILKYSSKEVKIKIKKLKEKESNLKSKQNKKANIIPIKGETKNKFKVCKKKKLRCKSYKKIKRRMNLITQNNKRITFFFFANAFLEAKRERERERERKRKRKQKKEKCC